MRITTLYTTVLMILLVLPMTVAKAGDEVYRWTDENGVVHFGDRADGNANAEKVIIHKGPDNSASPSEPDRPSGEDQQPAPQPSIAQQRRDERAKKRLENREKQNVIAEACAQRRQIVARLEPSSRVMVTNEDGTVSRLDDNVRLETLAEAKAYIAEKCDQ